MHCLILLVHAVCVATLVGAATADEYLVPAAEVRAVVPRGFTVSIPDAPGIELFAFHGHLNKPIADLEAGTFSKDILKAKNGRWSYENDRVTVRTGDKLYYWLYVQLNSRGYRRDEQVHTFGENPSPRPAGSVSSHAVLRPGHVGSNNTSSVLLSSFASNHAGSRPGQVGSNHASSDRRPSPASSNHVGSPSRPSTSASSLNCICPEYSMKPQAQCNPTITTVSGLKAPSQVCAGALIFEDNFDTLDFEKWTHEITMAGGGNWEFQLYSNNRSNSWVENGNLHIRPTLTIDEFGPNFLSSGTINLNSGSPADECTDPSSYGCERAGNPVNILNPIKSARLRTVNSFNFQYGRVEVRAKMPLGDWIWPAIWMKPRFNKYGVWPASGEIDISEVRSNPNLQLDGVNIGVEQTGSTLHYGPYYRLNGFERAHYAANRVPGLNADYHTYGLEWTDQFIKFTLDGAEVGTARPPAGGFWELGGFAAQEPQAENPWRTGGHMAPFDQQFHLILNVAVGGTNSYFPDQAVNNPPKPWSNQSPQAFLDFWNGRNQWYPTWNNGNGDSAQLQVDYVRIWAI